MWEKKESFKERFTKERIKEAITADTRQGSF